jgi:hypothetical protein
VGVEDEACDLVVLVGYERLGQDAVERHVGERQARGDVLLRACRRDARQPIAGAGRGRLRHQLLEAGESICFAADRSAVRHGQKHLIDAPQPKDTE